MSLCVYFIFTFFREFTVQEFKESNPPNVTVETPTKKDQRKKGRKAKKQGLKGTRRFPFFKSCDDVSRPDMNGEKVKRFCWLDLKYRADSLCLYWLKTNTV